MDAIILTVLNTLNTWGPTVARKAVELIYSSRNGIEPTKQDFLDLLEEAKIDHNTEKAEALRRLEEQGN
jgi:hypothetical protein